MLTNSPLDFPKLQRRFFALFYGNSSGSHWERLVAVRIALWKEKKDYHLTTDPLLDELCLVFADWCCQEEGGKMFFPERVFELSGDAHLSEYEFTL